LHSLANGVTAALVVCFWQLKLGKRIGDANEERATFNLEKKQPSRSQNMAI